MQAPLPVPSQRSFQRKSPAADPGPPPSVPARAISPTAAPQARGSTSSTKSAQSGGGRRQNGGASSQASQPGPPLSQIEKSVTHLLVATKQLLETLTQWSQQQATDTQVSDIYVRLGYEFNIACRAFSAINVDTSDLGNVPELLRHILEATLSQEASVENLERFLPKIRDIIINLLHGLKRKQQRLRQKPYKDGSVQNPEAHFVRSSSSSSGASDRTGLTSLLNEGIPENYRSGLGIDSRDSSLLSMQDNFNAPPRTSSTTASPGRKVAPTRDPSRGSVSSEQSSLSSTTMQNIPVLPPYPGDEVPVPRRSEPETVNVDAFPPPPPPPPKQNHALQALQRGPDLERRASRRYSAYQISKHLGATSVPMIPTAQNSPIPNRGRDVRESMNAVRGRGAIHNRQRSNNTRLLNESSPSHIPSRIPEEHSETSSDSNPLGEVTPEGSPNKLSDLDSNQSPSFDRTAAAALLAPSSESLPSTGVEEDRVVIESQKNEQRRQESSIATYSRPLDEQPNEEQFVPDQSPQPGKELTLFLQYKSKIKKFMLADGYSDLSMARLQLAFIEKFAWNTHNNGVDLPEIYIQDPISGVRHELEDLADVKDRSVLVLNIEALDEVKRHIDEGIGGLKKMVDGVRIAVSDQQATIQRVSDRQQETAMEMARLAAAPPNSTSARVSLIEKIHANGSPVGHSKVNVTAQLSEIQSIRRDLAVMRQIYSGFQSDIESTMSTIRTKAASVKAVALDASIPDFKGDTGRAYVNSGKKSLNEDSDKLVGQVDDLQDIVEDLRKDVVLRGVRPLPRQLETVAKDISLATKELKKMQEFLKRERPIWTKIWEKELETVCNDREEMTMQEDLAADLQDDLEKAAQTFALVEQATKEQMKDAPSGAVANRAFSRTLNNVSLTDPTLAKEGVLGEVRALQPNHENRLEAIERAEKLRQKELESRKEGEFQKELGEFVELGKLKKAGGYEEVERSRKAKDERIRREAWEKQNGMAQAEAGAVPETHPINSAT